MSRHPPFTAAPSAQLELVPIDAHLERVHPPHQPVGFGHADDHLADAVAA